MGNRAAVLENDVHKLFVSPEYNYFFDKQTGLFMRWGKDRDESPDFSPFGPELLDLEISSGGDCLGNCPFCYKCNGGDQPTHNMTLAEFKTIFHKMPNTLTQIAFGIMNIGTNPDFFGMMEYARQNGVIPNYTCHGLDVTPDIASRTAALCGAVAVSIVNQTRSYEAVKMFTDAGMKQVNIHFMLSEETFEKALSVVDDIASDARLANMNAIVFLQYKSKGRTPEAFHSIRSADRYRELMAYCDQKGVRYGFDSCSAPLFFRGIEGHPKQSQFEMLAEPCESGLFSSYINCYGQFFACSFCEEEPGWETGLDVLNCKSFMNDVWFSEKVVNWREIILASSRGCNCPSASICRSCPMFNVTSCKGA